MEDIMERLQDALSALKTLDRNITRGDIQDSMRAIGDFLYRDLDDVIFTIEDAIEEIRDSDEYIAALESKLAEVGEE